MSVTERIGTKPSWAAAVLVGLLIAASVACAGSTAAPGDSTVQPVVETDGDPEPQPTEAPTLETDGGPEPQPTEAPALETDQFDQ